MSNRPLQISKTISLPIDAAAGRFVALGKSGSGKTNAGVVFAEELLAHGVTTVILDVLGNMHGLRAAGDGPGLSIAIVGGPSGDVPLRPDRGAVVADLVATGVSAVVDLSELTREDAQRFAADFLERLVPAVRASGRNVHVIVEEAETFAPQTQTSKAHNAARSATTVFARVARNVGIGWTFSTQRPQLLSKDVIDSSTAFLAMRMTGDLAQAAIGAEVRSRVGKTLESEILQDLPKLRRGEAWLVPDPDWLGDDRDAEPVKFQFRWRHTFDSARPPKVGEHREEPRRLADVDVALLRASMLPQETGSAETGDRSSDVALLRGRIAELEAQLTEEREFRNRTIARGIDFVCDQALRFAEEAVASISTIRERIVIKRDDGDDEVAPVAPAQGAPLDGRPDHDAVETAAGTTQPEPRPVKRVRPTEASPTPASGAKGKGVQAILDALAQRHPKPCSRQQVALLSGYSPKSSTFDMYLSRARTAGKITGAGDALQLTELGRAETDVRAPRTSRDVIAFWLGRVDGGPRKLLQVLVEDYPASVPRAKLAERSAYSLTSSTFETHVSRLKSAGLATVANGVVRASDELFPTGRPR